MLEYRQETMLFANQTISAVLEKTKVSHDNKLFSRYFSVLDFHSSISLAIETSVGIQ
jgi:hypothetical protein